MELVLSIVCILIGSYIGWHLREVVAERKVKQFIKYMEEQSPATEESQDMVRVSVEKHDNTFFVYDSTNKFIAQANTREELEDKLAEMYPGKRFGVSPENLKEVGFIK